MPTGGRRCITITWHSASGQYHQGAHLNAISHSRLVTGSRAPALALLGVTGFLCWVAIKILIPNFDTAWLLELTRRMLHGGRYYQDFYELNPPLFPILMLPVYALGRVTHLTLDICFLIYLSALIYVACLAVCTFLSDAMPEISKASRIFMTAGMEAAIFFLPGPEFGERDHVAVTLFLPAVFWLAGRPSARLTAGVSVILAVAILGLLIKPFLLVIGLAVAMTHMLSTRSAKILFGPAALLACGVMALYVLVILILFPEWLTMAKVAASFYNAYNSPYGLLDERSRTGLIELIVLALANELLPGDTSTRRTGRYLAAAALGAIGSYVIQRKGWPYHYIPATILLRLLMLFVALAALSALRRFVGEQVYSRRAALVVLGFLITLLPAYTRTWVSARADRIYYQEFAMALAASGAGSELYFFSTDVFPQFPLNFFYPFTPHSRLPCLWTLPGILRRDREAGADPARPSRLDMTLIDMVRQDFRKWIPDAIIVDESPVKTAIYGPFDFVQWFRRDPDMQRLLDGYVLDRRIDFGGGRNSRYAIYRRSSPGPVPAPLPLQPPAGYRMVGTNEPATR